MSTIGRLCSSSGNASRILSNQRRQLHFSTSTLACPCRRRRLFVPGDLGNFTAYRLTPRRTFVANAAAAQTSNTAEESNKPGDMKVEISPQAAKVGCLFLLSFHLSLF